MMDIDGFHVFYKNKSAIKSIWIIKNTSKGGGRSNRFATMLTRSWTRTAGPEYHLQSWQTRIGLSLKGRGDCDVTDSWILSVQDRRIQMKTLLLVGCCCWWSNGRLSQETRISTRDWSSQSRNYSESLPYTPFQSISTETTNSVLLRWGN